MGQPLDVKQKVARNKFRYWNGYFGPESSQANKTESKGYYHLLPIYDQTKLMTDRL